MTGTMTGFRQVGYLTSSKPVSPTPPFQTIRVTPDPHSKRSTVTPCGDKLGRSTQVKEVTPSDSGSWPLELPAQLVRQPSSGRCCPRSRTV